jgi:hypothetical protein
MAARTFSELFELARVLVRSDYIARFIVNANHSRTNPAIDGTGSARPYSRSWSKPIRNTRRFRCASRLTTRRCVSTSDRIQGGKPNRQFCDHATRGVNIYRLRELYNNGVPCSNRSGKSPDYRPPRLQSSFYCTSNVKMHSGRTSPKTRSPPGPVCTSFCFGNICRELAAALD